MTLKQGIAMSNADKPWRLNPDNTCEVKALSIRPESICFVNGTMQINSELKLPDVFWLHLAEVIPPILVKRFKGSETKYLAIESLEAHAEGQPLLLLPRVCLQGVWWTRRAAVEADRDISAFVRAESQHA